LKVGVGILEDALMLEKDYTVDVKGCLDLRILAEPQEYWKSGLSLKRLCEQHLGRKLSQDPVIRCGNWEVPFLNDQQQLYAAQVRNCLSKNLTSLNTLGCICVSGLTPYFV
jgi:hypothetical protein